MRFQYGKMSFDKLKEVFNNAKFHSYEGMEHSSSDDELMDVFNFMKTVSQ